MAMNISEQNGITILALSGKIMGGPQAVEINEQINTLIDQGKRRIIIDLKDVEWMNSSGLGILIGAITTLRNNNGSLILVNISERIENLLKITKLHNLFTIYPDVETAVKSL